MTLTDRLNGVARGSRRGRAPSKESFQFKSRVHRALIDRLDLRKLRKAKREELEGEFRQEIVKTIHELRPNIKRIDERRLVEEVLREAFGLGPLEPLLKDPTVEEIMVNGSKEVYCARDGKLLPTDTIFQDNLHLMDIIDHIVSQVGRRIDESSPMVDARLMDGSRVNAIIPPLSLNGPCLTIRKFPSQRLKANDLVAFGTLTWTMVDLLRDCVKARLNILISGGTGSGKTTFLNVLSGFIPHDERIVTIEDTAELQLQQPHVVRLETRPPDLDGQGGLTQRDLVRNSLRMRPDRIIVGEVRGPEALDMLQAMNTGHDGSISTVHANSPRDALSRVEVMIAMSSIEVPLHALRRQMVSSIDVIIHLARLPDGSRKVTTITQLSGIERDMICLEDIYTFAEKGWNGDENGEPQHAPTGIRPRFFKRFETLGIPIDKDFLNAAAV